MANYIKREIDNFDYNDRYYVPNEHKWCFMKDDEKFDEFNKKKDELVKPRFTKTQSNPELTGQVGPYTGGSSSDTGDSDEEKEDDPKEEPEKSEQPNNEIWYTTPNNEVIAKFDISPDEFDALYHTDWNKYDELGNPMTLESHIYDNESTFKHGVATYNRDVTFVPVFSVVTPEPVNCIYFSETITHISKAAFIGMDLKGLYFYSENPPIVEGINDEYDIPCMFDGEDEDGNPTDSMNYPIYVPKNSLDAYKAAFGWSKYSERLKPIE